MDRRVLTAIVLMMLIAIVPSFFMDKPARKPVAVDSTRAAQAGAPESSAAAAPGAAPGAAPAAAPGAVSAAPALTAPADTIRVGAPLYEYGISTAGARIVSARMLDYPSHVPGSKGQPAELVRRGDAILGLTLVTGRDTIPLRSWTFTPSDSAVTVAGGPRTVRFTGSRGPISAEIAYTFQPDGYRIGVSGRITGLGPDGGLLLVGLGHGVRNTEADLADNRRSYAIVTKSSGTERTDLSGLTPGETKTLSGPFEWVGVKSKYFVEALFAFDSAGPGRVSGVVATPSPRAGKHPSSAAVQATLPVTATGQFDFSVYAGPMEYNRLQAIGHDFDDVNPYGWPGFRTLIRFFAVPVRALLVFMHTQLGLAYGLALILIGVLIRALLWPLNAKALRSSMAMQSIQPQVKAMQEKYKNDPQRAQQEMFKLYKEHNVNPLGGCWPNLLPMPVLFALFFVFQNTIELRGQPFLWVPDLAQADPLLIIPVVMALSTFLVSWLGQRGMTAGNPQARMMMYFMPAMMFVMFYRFAAGLNLYYAVSNLMGVPQQWMLARERQRRDARTIVEVRTKSPERGTARGR